MKRGRLITTLGALGVGGLAACSGASQILPAQSDGYSGAPFAEESGVTTDVIVVGCGLAGIGAARTVLSYGRSVMILEARDRVGGRVHCDNTTFPGFAFDYGAQFFQQVVSGNILFQIAKARGVKITDVTTFPALFYLGAKRAPDADSLSLIATYADMLSSILAAGAKISTPRQDFAVSNVTDAYKRSPWYQNAVMINATGISLVEPAESSLLDLTTLLEVSPAMFITPGDFYITKIGMGNFVASLAGGLPVRLSEPAMKIARDSAGVTVTTRKATYRARAVVVTAPMSVLASGGIDFTPELPADVRDAFAELPLGVLYKFAIGFKPGFLKRFSGPSVVSPLTKTPNPPTYFVKLNGQDLLEGLMEHGEDIEAKSRSQQISFVLGIMEKTFPGAANAFDGRFTSTSWSRQLYSQGSWSYAKIGGVGARTLLRAPIGKLFFAGEALGIGGLHSSMHGAYTSGIAQATAALKSIGVNVESRTTAR